MTRAPAHLITGATGFVGGALALELLRRTDAPIIALVRPGPNGARERFRQVIQDTARAYDVALTPETFERCHVVAGDITREGCGLETALVGRISQVWHSAASLRYENRYVDEIRATNVDGTRNVLDLAVRAGASHLNYVSTAYVSGRRTGDVREDPSEEADSSNHYERSKAGAEQLVRASSGVLRVRILRPSVVVGHSRTLTATTFSGFYGFFRQLVQFRGITERAQRGLLERTAMQICAEPDAPINLVPVNVVAHEAAAIGLDERSEGIYHLTHPAPPTVGTCIREFFRLLGMHPPEFVQRSEQLDWLAERFDKRLEFYRCYIIGDRRFDRTRTNAALGSDVLAAPSYDTAMIGAMASWYLPILEAQRTSRPVAR